MSTYLVNTSLVEEMVALCQLTYCFIDPIMFETHKTLFRSHYSHRARAINFTSIEVAVEYFNPESTSGRIDVRLRCDWRLDRS